ncbi:MAG TPA: CoA ester lyase [Anaerolineaceae bacterium]|nr:CoA ester lyase [Anaerolineaceae bacterium]
MRARRAFLYMPGDDLHKIQKATTLGVDCICMDLEDGVAFNRKEAARATILKALQTLPFGRAERLVRINPPGSGMEEIDLNAILPGRPDGIVLPKIGSASSVQWASARLAEAEREFGWPYGEIILLALIETARGVVNLKEIAGADPRLQALIFGPEDLAGDIGAVRTRDGWEIFYARSAVVIHAAAFGLQAIDMVFMDLKDLEGLARESQEGARMAYSGKQVIHPRQVGPVQEAFTPSDEAIAHALRIVQNATQRQEEGQGAFALDGKMVDAPVVKAAERVLERARAAGKIE